MTWKRAILLLFALAVVAGGVVGWINYRRLRADYDAYRALIQPGIKIAGVDVGWDTPAQAAAKISERVAKPYFADFTLNYQGQPLALSPAKDLAFQIPVQALVDQAVAASHRYDYWKGFKDWLQGKGHTLDLDIPLEMSFDTSAASRYLAPVARQFDVLPVEAQVDNKALAFIPGRPGHLLQIEDATALINERVTDPAQREVTLPVKTIEPDESLARIKDLLEPLGPALDKAPVAPSYYTATIPISSTGGLANTPLVTYTGELTWTFPHFAGYPASLEENGGGPLTSTYAFLFDPGKPGTHFDVEQAVSKVETALKAGGTTTIALAVASSPAPSLTVDLLLPPLKARLDEFPGVSSVLIKNLDTGKVLLDQNNDFVMAGMSVVKIGIMIEVYRYYGGKVDEQTHQELLKMLGRESCNPCANRLMAAIGGGSAVTGARMVTATMKKLGLSHFLLCSPFQIAENSPLDSLGLASHGNEGFASEGRAVAGAMGGKGGTLLASARVPTWRLTSAWLADPVATPRYDPCVHATPREMANLLDSIYQCTQGKGVLPKTYPGSFTPPLCGAMMDIMAANDLRYPDLGAGIPAEVRYAHKHGYAGYDAPWGDTRADVGIVFSPGATYLVSFYIWEDSPWIDFGVAQPIYRDVSNMLYNYFNPSQPYWPLPPWAP